MHIDRSYLSKKHFIGLSLAKYKYTKVRVEGYISKNTNKMNWVIIVNIRFAVMRWVWECFPAIFVYQVEVSLALPILRKLETVERDISLYAQDGSLEQQLRRS